MNRSELVSATAEDDHQCGRDEQEHPQHLDIEHTQQFMPALTTLDHDSRGFTGLLCGFLNFLPLLLSFAPFT